MIRGTSTQFLRSRVFKLALIYLCLFSAAVLGLVGFVYWYTTQSLTRQIDATIDAEIRGLAEQYAQRGTIGLLAAVDRRSASASANRGLYLLVDRHLQPLAGNLPRWPDVAPNSQGWITFPLEYPDSEGEAAINFGRARLFELGGGLRLLVGHDIRERTRVAELVGESLGWGLALVVALSLVGGLLMSRSLLHRIDDINTASREIMAGQLDRRVPVSKRGDEFDEVAGNLNAMLDQIQRLLAATKQVSDNIAHDLRSPLARLRSRLEVTLMEDPAQAGYREATESTVAEIDQVLKTFQALLDISEAEAGAARRNFALVDLSEVTRDVSELYEPVAEERGMTLCSEVAGDIRVRGERNLLFQALSNLLDNAIKYGAPDGRVTVTLAGTAGTARIAVADNGPGVPPELRGRVLERFYRVDPSRNEPGSGLGLSLTAATAKLHGGAIRLEDNAPGLRVVLELPRAAPPRVSLGPAAD